MVTKRFEKLETYPRPHNKRIRFRQSLVGAAAQKATIIPIAFYDEGLGAANSYKSNPQNSSFAETDQSNCYPNSRINQIECSLAFDLTKGAIETDKISTLRMAFMPIFISFKEDQEANDELTGLDIGEIIEMQKEATDRQSYPLFTGTKLTEAWSNSALMPAAQPGLTTTQVLEAVAFDEDVYYDALQYYQNSGKLKAVQGGLNWITLNAKKSHRVHINVTQRSKTKFMNPYTFFGVLVYLPNTDTLSQIPLSGDVTSIAHVNTTVVYRYNEWNQDFDHKKGA